MRKKETIVFIGNSIVNGFPLPRSACFVSLFRDQTGHNVINQGVNGNTIAQVKDRFQQDALSHNPDAVYILTGTSDFIDCALTPDAALETYLHTAQMAKEQAVRTIFLTPLLVDKEHAQKKWREDADYDRIIEELKEMRKKMLGIDKTKFLHVLDTQDYFHTLSSTETPTSYLVDGLHPTRRGHEALADFLVHDGSLKGQPTDQE